MIRPFGLWDLLMMRHLVARGSAFDLRRILLNPVSPLLASAIGAATRQMLGPKTWVWRGEHCAQQGLVQVVSRANRAEWNLTFMAPALEACRESPEIWHDLLCHVVASAAERGIMRIYAYAPQDDEAESTLRGAGFTLVTREEIFCLPQYPAPAPPPKGLRRVDSRDAWALDQLYRRVVPPQVQKAEGMLARWSRAGQRGVRRWLPNDEYVWEDKGQVLAYLGLSSGPKGYWLEIIVRPEQRADILPYVKHVISQADSSPYRPIYCPVTDYSVGLGWILRTLQFDMYARQVLFVAHTVAHVSVARPLLVHTLDGSIESVHQQPT